MVIDAQMSVFSRVWYRGCALAFQANEANSSFAARSKLNLGNSKPFLYSWKKFLDYDNCPQNCFKTQ